MRHSFRSFRSIPTLLVAFGVLWCVLLLAPSADAQAPSSTTVVPTSIDAGSGAGALGQILPEPNSGRAPQVDGDRGSRSQLIAFFALAGGLVLIGSLAARDIRRGKAAKAARAATSDQDAAASTLSDPDPDAESSVNPPSSSARQ